MKAILGANIRAYIDLRVFRQKLSSLIISRSICAKGCKELRMKAGHTYALSSELQGWIIHQKLKRRRIGGGIAAPRCRRIGGGVAAPRCSSWGGSLHIYIYNYICDCVQMHMYIHTCTEIFAHTVAHTHTCTYTCIQAHQLPPQSCPKSRLDTYMQLYTCTL